MNHVLSTHVIVNHRLTSVWLERVWNAGIPAVEIFCAKQHLDWRNKAQVAELGHWFRDAQLKLHSLHSPMYTDEIWGRSGPQSVINITEPEKGKRIAMVDEIKRAIEVAEVIPFQYMIQHLGHQETEYDERRVDAAFTSMEELSLFARQRGVEILLENIPNAHSSASRLISFLEITHLDLHFCLDAGHANLNEGIAEAYDRMKDRIRSTHLHDNDGESDKHLFPFLAEGGTINWRGAVELLFSRPEQYPLLLELKEDPQFQNPFAVAREILDRMEKLAVSIGEEEPVR